MEIPLQDADLPISPRTRRVLTLERGEADEINATSLRQLVRQPPDTAESKTPSSTSEGSNRRRRRHKPTADGSGATLNTPWFELCGTASPSTILRLLAALLVVLFVFDFTVESLTIAFCDKHNHHQPPHATGWLSRVFHSDDLTTPAREEENPSLDAGVCSPDTIDLSAIGASRQRHRFYDLLVRRGPPTPPIFTREFEVLCEAGVRHQSRFGYCLPIGGRTDAPFCDRADRMDLLIPSINTTGFCEASVLHMLFVHAFEELQALQATPLVAYGTLLGAVRNGSMIPYTEDADIAYAPLSPDELETFKQRLWDQGFHVFYFSSLWRVCVAPTHPLASVLFTPDKGLTRNYKVPYVDLYEMRAVEYDDGTFWDLFGTLDDRLLPGDKVFPVATVQINGMAFDTFADPVDFLTDEYGEEFMTPVMREHKKSNGFNFMEAFLEEEVTSKPKETKEKKAAETNG